MKFRNLLNKIIPTTVFIGVLILGRWYINYELNRPILSYEILPSLDLNNQYISGFIVKNEGRVLVQDLIIIINNLESPVESVIVESEDANWFLDSSIGDLEVNIELSRLVSGEQLTIYVITAEDNGSRKLSVSAQGTTRVVENRDDTLLIVNLIFFILLFATIGLSVYSWQMQARIEIKENTALLNDIKLEKRLAQFDSLLDRVEFIQYEESLQKTTALQVGKSTEKKEELDKPTKRSITASIQKAIGIQEKANAVLVEAIALGDKLIEQLKQMQKQNW